MGKSNKNIASSTGLVAALASSLCCIAPLLSILGGISGGASMFDWISPFRPYLMVLSILALGYAFYQAYKPKQSDNCGCDVNEKTSFFNSKGFLWTITIFSVVMFTFPYYSSLFYNTKNKEIIGQKTETIELKINGMTCESCENHVDAAALNLNGVFSSKSSYQEGVVKITYITDSISVREVSDAIEKTTGYTVTN